ncbi:MAG: hypothetical protein LUC41_05860 [Clostridiales bacterium]|nr:hypothetical protein [Clostridiales bacterium]
MAQTYYMISMIGFVLAAAFAVVAVILWIKFRIPKIVGDLSGRTARKSIEEARKKNEESSDKESGINDFLHPDENVQLRQAAVDSPEEDVTERMSGILADTCKLPQEERGQPAAFNMLQDIVMIHTNETIQD